MNSTNVFVYYWKTEEITEKSNFHTELRIYGIDENGKNTCLRVEDFRSKIYLQFSDNDYLTSNFSEIKNLLSSLVYNPNDKNSIKLVHKEKLYGTEFEKDGTRKLYPFIKMFFSSRIAMFSFRKNIYSLGLKCDVKIHEMNASPETQFIAERKINVTGWINISSAIDIPESEKITRCEKEYLISKIQVLPSEKDDPVDIKVMSWDIEAKCHDISKNPGDHIHDCVFQISCVCFNVLTKKHKKYLLTLGECDHISDDIEILKFNSEKNLIIGFANLIIKEKSNILNGWNIFKFDIPFMLNRAERLMCAGELLSCGFNKETPGDIIKIKWTSSAFQTVDIKYIDLEGILFIDGMEIVSREYKLDSYSLNNVSSHFLEAQKDDITFKDLMYAYNCFLNKKDNVASEFCKIGKYCVQDSVLSARLFEHLEMWLSIAELSKVTYTSITNVHVYGQQKRVYNQIYMYCYVNNIVVETDAYNSKITDRYTGAYVIDPVPGLYEYVVPLDFASLYPSIMIAYNIDFKTIITNDKNIENVSPEDIQNVEWEDHIACEHDPKVIQIKLLTDLIENPRNDTDKKINMKKRAELTKKLSKNVICQKNKFKIIKSNVYKGVLPTIVQGLLDARKKVRTILKTTTDPIQKLILEKRQLSYKISANSVYGATGVKSGILPFMPIAMCVTSLGRESIKKASKILYELGGTIVYGDTDSNYITFDDITGEHKEKCQKIWERAISVAEIISSHFPKPMRIDFEEVIYYKFFILTKKRYMYYKCSQVGEISKKIGQKGVLLARRDNSKFLKNIYENTIVDVFEKKQKDEIMTNIFNNILELYYLNFDYKILKISKSVNDYNHCVPSQNEDGDWYMGKYKLPKPKDGLTNEERLEFFISRLPAQVQLEIKVVERGDDKIEGVRLEFIILKKEGVSKLSEHIEQFKYFVENKNSQQLKIDYMYYINSLKLPLEQIFSTAFKVDNFVNNSLKIFETKQKLNKELKMLFSPKITYQ